MMQGETLLLQIPSRDVPMPTGISEEAKAILAAPRPPRFAYPAVEAIDEWRRMVAAMNAGMVPVLQARVGDVTAEVQDRVIGGVAVYDIRPPEVVSTDQRVIMDIHGGAYILGFGDACRAQAIGVAQDLGRKVISIDYRSPPDHPFPAALDDCLTVYRALIDNHGAGNIVVGGTSAGANLTAALILRARDEGLPLPAGAMLHTPHLDMTNGSDSLYANQGLDAVLSGPDLTSIREIYTAGHDIQHPYISPLFGDFTKGFPPTILSTGTRDLFLSDTVRMHAALRAADVPAELHVTEAASHGNFHGAPEEEHITREVRKFLASVWRG